MVENIFENISPQEKIEIRKVLIEKGKEIINENEALLKGLNEIIDQISKYPEYRGNAVLELNTLKTNFISYGDTEKALKCQQLIDSCETEINSGGTEKLISSLNERSVSTQKLIDEAKSLVSALENTD